METMMARSGRFLALSGLAAIAFGIIVLVWPRLSLLALLWLFGAFSLVYGVFLVGSGLNLLANRSTEWVPYVLGGAAGLAIGAIAFLRPGITALALVYLIAAFAILTGIFQFIAAIDLHGKVEGDLWLGLSGVISFIFGVLIAIWPGSGVLAVLWFIGLYAILSGVSLLVAAFQIHGLQTRLKRAVSARGAQRTTPT
jgi:uncharacterized membrane protein HdeD (DUF308 family)